MSTNTIVGIIVAVVVVGGGLWYLNRSDAPAGPEMNGTSEEGSGVSTFAALIAQGGSRTCSMTVQDEGMTSEGTVYIANGNVRGDFTTTTNGQAMTGHMIQTGGYVYSWSDAVSQGVKMRIDAQEASSAESQSIDPNAQVEYDCSSWTPDQSMFTPPSNVTFMEFGASGAAGGTLPAGVPHDIPEDLLPSY